jgi:hypothetical protein
MSDRKYRHRGYQDDDRDRDREPKQRPERPKTDGVRRYDDAPRGRGLGAPTKVAFRCARCGRDLVNLVVENDTTCPGCQSPLHSCSNCNFFDTGAPFECRKELEARVESKTKANECPHFQPKSVRDLGLTAKENGRTDGPGGTNPNDPRAAFDALLKK